MMPATVNLEVDMVAQRSGGSTTIPPALQLAVPGSMPIGLAHQEPDPKRVKATPPRMQQKRAAVGPARASSETLRSSRRVIWPSAEDSPSILELSPSPPKVHLDASGWTTEKLVEQMEKNQRYVQQLQDTIETMRLSQLQHMADLVRSRRAPCCTRRPSTTWCIGCAESRRTSWDLLGSPRTSPRLCARSTSI